MTEDFQLVDGLLTIRDGVQYLKSQQFAQNPDIVSVFIPDSVGFMEEEVFAECENLKEVRLPSGLVNIGVATFVSCIRLESIVLPSSIKTIDDGAFLFCEGLKSINLPNGLESILQLSFQNTGLESITIPETVRKIGEEAFFECESLTEVNVLGKNTVIGKNAFGSNYKLIKGYIAPGYPEEDSPPAEMLYSMLWASCPSKHEETTSTRAESFIRNNESLVMERIFKYNNIPALNGISERRLLEPSHIDAYVKTALELGMTEVTALLLKAKGEERNNEGEFDL